MKSCIIKLPVKPIGQLLIINNYIQSNQSYHWVGIGWEWVDKFYTHPHTPRTENPKYRPRLSVPISQELKLMYHASSDVSHEADQQ